MSNVFDKVPGHFSGLNEDDFKQFYGPSTDLIANQIGDMYYQSEFFGEQSLSHRQLSNWLGGFCLYNMSSTSYRFWSDTDELVDELPWSMAVWRLMHILPLGHAFADYSFKINPSVSWNPVLQPAINGMKVKGSNRSLNANSISQAIFHKLFPEYFEGHSPMFLFALLDCFSEKPNNDNPFYVSIRNAIRATLIDNPYPIPFFWHRFILQFLSRSETDIADYQSSLSSNAKEHIFSPNNEKPKAPINRQNETSSLAPTTSLQKIAGSIDFTNITNPNYNEIDGLLQELGEQIRKRIDSGDFPLNGPNAFAHKVEERFFLSYPHSIEKIRELLGSAVEFDVLDRFLQKLSLILIRDATINARNRIVDIELAELHVDFVPVFFKDYKDIVNNDSVQLKEQTSSEPIK